MPKVKSSSGIFSRKSKFRFTGRCENEVINSQSNDANSTFGTVSVARGAHDGAGGGYLSSSMLNDTDTSMDMTHLNVKYATLPLTTTATLSIGEGGQNHVQLRSEARNAGAAANNVFKRRTFISTSTLKSLHNKSRDASLNLNTTAKSDTDTDDTTAAALNTSSIDNSGLTVSTSKLNNSSTNRLDVSAVLSEQESRGAMNRSSSSGRLEATNDSDHNNNLLAEPGADSKHMNGSLSKNQLLNEAVSPKESAAAPGTVLVADFLRDGRPVSPDEAAAAAAGRTPVSITLRRQDSSRCLPRMKSVYLSTVDYVHSKTADRLIFFTFLFIIIAVILIWFVNKQCLSFGWSDTSRVCQVTNQLSHALSLGKHGRSSASQRWPAYSQLAASSRFTTASNRTASSARSTVLDPLFSWFFSHYEE